MNINSISIIGKPFNFEGKKRLDTFNIGLENLKNKTNEIITIDNNLNEESIKKIFEKRDLEFAKEAIKAIK